MNIHNLDRIFKPQRIAIIGVTPNPKSVGGKVLINLVTGGFRGVVYPVSSTSEAIMGIPCYAGLDRLPKLPDLGIICAPAAQVPGLVRQCGEAGISGLIINSAGFRETGAEGAALEEQIRQEQARFAGMRILGPNCLGVIAPGHQLNASFASALPRPGHVAFISQSGALCTSVLDWAIQERIGFSAFVSIGNALDVDFADLIDYFGEDEQTRSILLYIESIQHARKFMTAARAFARSKPIIAYKAGRFPESAEAAASHTGALAAEDAVYDAAFQRAGLSRVFEIDGIFAVAELLGRHKIPKGPRLGIVTNAGGPGVMATDALMAASGTLARLAPETMARLDDALPPFWSRRNPVDVLGDAKSKLYAKAVQAVLDDPGVDAVLVIVTPQAMTNPAAIAREMVPLAAASAKPLLGAWLGGASMREGMNILGDANIPAYATPEQAVRAFMTLVAYSRNLEILYETPKDIPVEFILDRDQLRQRFAEILAGSPSGVLSEHDSKTILEGWGIPVSRTRLAASAEEAAAAARETGFPVVLKIYSPGITHKTDVGGVVLDVRSEEAVRQEFDAMLARVARLRPEARLAGVTVQPMIAAGDGVELILGTKQDPTFGTVLMAGLGGIAAEIMGDRALGFPPLNERLARRMLESLKIWPLLQGYRGRPPVDLDRLVEVIIRLSYLVAEHPEIRELDINPLRVSAAGVLALDARIVTGPVPAATPGRPYSEYPHLALRPYPGEYIQRVFLEDGTEILLRPIKPEDEPLWLELLGSCSKESIYSRFRHFFHWQSHEVATRFCYIDYAREIAMVAEVMEQGRRRLIGVGRLIAEPDLSSVEYAVLVNDAWQERGIGSILTDACCEIAVRWGIRKITAVTTSDNHRMVAVFRKRGFTIHPGQEDSLVEVSKELS